MLSGFSDILSSFGGFFSNLTDTIGNFFTEFTSTISTFFSDLLQSIGASFQGVFDSLAVLRDNMLDFKDELLSFLQYLNPFDENFILKVALVPQEGYFNTFFQDISNSFNDRLPLVGQIAEFMNTIKSINVSQDLPEFNITMPDKYGGGNYAIINFAFFLDYRVYILNFIRFSSWFFFIKRIFKQIPTVIYR